MRTAPALKRALLLLATLLLSAGCSESGDDPSTAEHQATVDPDVPQAPPIERAQLRLRLNLGDRFPLRKVVEQELIQTFPGEPGRVPESSRSRLEMLLAITVEDAGNEGAWLAVRYNRIRYSHDVGGAPLAYDSAQPPIVLPLELAAYQGMVGKGFSFRIGADNRIAGVEGFAAFVQTALANVPVENRNDVLLGVEAGTGADGVADFIDDTIGLLPYNAPKAAGDSWRRTRRIARPVPMHIDTLCTLRELTGELAVVDVRGDVTPVISSGIQTVAHESMHIVVERGTTVGECVLFRDSGLPKESRIVQEFEMSVNLLGKLPVRQHKRVVTTVESYPALRAADR